MFIYSSIALWRYCRLKTITDYSALRFCRLKNDYGLLRAARCNYHTINLKERTPFCQVALRPRVRYNAVCAAGFAVNRFESLKFQGVFEYMAGNEKKQKTQRFALIRLMDFKDEIERLREHNPQYDLSVSELKEAGFLVADEIL